MKRNKKKINFYSSLENSKLLELFIDIIVNTKEKVLSKDLNKTFAFLYFSQNSQILFFDRRQIYNEHIVAVIVLKNKKIDHIYRTYYGKKDLKIGYITLENLFKLYIKEYNTFYLESLIFNLC